MSPSEAWNTTLFEYFLLHEIKYGETQERERQEGLTRSEAESLRSQLDAEIAKERRDGSR